MTADGGGEEPGERSKSPAGDSSPTDEAPDSPGPERESASNSRDEDLPAPDEGPVAALRWVLGTSHPTVSFVRELVSSVLAVALVGLLLFAVSGVWPPMVAVESGSMDPNLKPGDLVFVIDEHRYGGPGDAGTGVIGHRTGAEVGHYKFNGYGDVIVFSTPGRGGPPIIHRAHFWVEEGENWFDRANESYIDATACEAPDPSDDLANCPAPHDGFVTKGDNNPHYDQANGLSGPVRPEWIRGTAEVSVPYLGCVRLWASGNPPPACRP